MKKKVLFTLICFLLINQQSCNASDLFWQWWHRVPTERSDRSQNIETLSGEKFEEAETTENLPSFAEEWEEWPEEEFESQEELPRQLTKEEFFSLLSRDNPQELENLYEKIIDPFYDEISFRGEPINGVTFQHPKLEIIQLKVPTQITKNSCAYEVLYAIWCLQLYNVSISNLLNNTSLRTEMIKKWSAIPLLNRNNTLEQRAALFVELDEILGRASDYQAVIELLNATENSTHTELLQERHLALNENQFIGILDRHLDNLEGEEIIQLIQETMPNRLEDDRNKIIVFENKDFINQEFLEILGEITHIQREAINNLKHNIANNIPSTLSCIALTSSETAAHWILLEVHTFADRPPQLIITDSLQKERVFNDEIVHMFINLIMPRQDIYEQVLQNDVFTQNKLTWAIDYSAQQIKQARTETDKEFYRNNYYLLRDRYFNMTGAQAAELDIWGNND